MPPVSVLLKPSSSLCNMACRYCFYCDEACKRHTCSYGFMSGETLKNVIRKTMLRAESAISYVWQGGEPTLRGLDFFKEAVAYQMQYNKHHITVQNALQTNGLTLDEDWCRFFHEHSFLVGLSVDGTREIHDALRPSRSGDGTFSRILESAKLMDRFHVEYNILTVVTPEIAGQIQKIYAFYKKKGWRYQQYIACLDPLDEPRGHRPYSLLPEVYGRFLSDLFDLWYADFQRKEQPYIRQFENYIALAAGYMPEACDQRGVCSVQNVVEADGSVYPCDFYMLDKYRLGNFNVDSLDQIDAARKRLGFLEESLKLDSSCRTCPWFRLCRGGCQRSRDLQPETGLYRNYFCPGFRIFFEHCADRIMKIAREL